MPRMKIPTKRKAAATPSTSSSTTPSPPRQDIQREIPHSELARRDIIYEKVFPIDSMRRRPECQWAIDLLEKNNMLSICLPQTLEIYPRLVRLFYQNMRLGPGPESPENFIEYTIDGHHRRLTIADIGQIMGLPATFDEAATPYLRTPLSLRYDTTTFLGIVEDLGATIERGSGESIVLSSLPDKLWFLDRILRENIFPYGHNSERRTDLLWALYSALRGHYFSIPRLILTCFWRMRSEIMARTPTGKARPLPLPYMITFILERTGYPLDPRESSMDVEMDFPLSRWIASHSRMTTAREKKRERDAAASAAAASTSTATARTRPPRAARSSDPEIRARLTRLEYMMTAMARHTLGDGFEEMIAAEEQRAQRGKTTVEDDSDDEDADYDAEATEDDDEDDERESGDE